MNENRLKDQIAAAFHEKKLALTGKARAHALLPKNEWLEVGIQTVDASTNYDWKGLHRPGDAAASSWLFQYTLSGWGLFERQGKVTRVEQGQGFCVKIPSSHRYRQDPRCPTWSFFWILIHQSYVMKRLFSHQQLVNRVVTLEEGSSQIQSAVKLISMIADQSAVENIYDIEEDMFSWMLEIERWAFAKRHPKEARTKLLNLVRNHLQNQSGRRIKVDELGKTLGMSRTNFTHYFRATTGISPAAFIRNLRLKEAARLLHEGKLSVKEVAAQTGFCDTNHLCKCYRERFKVSPGYHRLRKTSGNETME